jgi:CRP/FNR family transcriptional regulator, cyclic AMP receptor protein
MERDEGLQVLAESRWLAATPPEFRTAFLALARWHRAEAGAAITLAGDEAEDIIGLAFGTVGFTLTHGRPDTPMLHLAKAPFWMGYGPLLLGRPRVVTVIARAPCRFASFSRSKLFLLAESRPGWWRPFTALVGEYGDTTSLIAADLAIPGSEIRLLAVLLRFGGVRFAGSDDAGPVVVAVTQDELAAAANLSRNSVGTILRRLAAEGLVEVGYAGVTLHEPARLRAMLDR